MQRTIVARRVMGKESDVTSQSSWHYWKDLKQLYGYCCSKSLVLVVDQRVLYIDGAGSGIDMVFNKRVFSAAS